MKKTLILILFLLLLALTFAFCTDPEGDGLSYDYDGSWGEEGQDDGQFYSPGGIFVFPDVEYGARGSSGSVFITDTFNHRIQVFDLEMVSLDTFGEEGTGQAQFQKPSSVSVNVHLTPETRGSSGSVFITDTFNHRIQVFDLAGNYIAEFGEEGTGQAQFNQPSGISVSPITVSGSSGSVFITDTFNHRIQVFDLQGNYVDSFGEEGSGEGQFSKPGGIVFIPDYSEYNDDSRGNGRGSSGSVFITDTFNHRIQIYTGDGVYVDSFGEQGSGDGQFNEPEGIATDLEGNIYVADKGNHRVQIFDSEGNFLGKFGEQGSETGQFESPEDLSVDAKGNVYVSDTGNHRIQKFTPKHSVLSGFVIEAEQNPSAGTPSTVNVKAVDQNGNVYTAFSGKVNLLSNNANVNITPSSLDLTDGEGSVDITYSNSGDVSLIVPYNYSISQSNNISVSIAKVYVSPTGNDSNDGSSSAPLLTIETALTTANGLPKPVDIIVAGDGGNTYTINSSISLIDRISLKGGYESSGWTRDIVANETIIEDISTTGGTSTDLASVFSVDSTITSSTIVEGLTIKASTSGNDYTAGIYINGGSPVISQCKILGGGGATKSYGIFNEGNAMTTIRGNHIEGGSGGLSYGVYSTNVSSVQIYNNTIEGGTILNTYGVYNESASTIVRNNTIFGGNGTNFSVGVYMMSAGSVIENNIIYSDTTSTAPICVYESDATSSPASLRNNNLFDFNASGLTVLYYDDGITQITGLAGVEALANIDSLSGNISVDPVFVTAGSDYHLGVSSPVSVTAGGINGSVGAEAWGFDIDKDGNSRTGTGANGWTIGAYEYDG